VADGDFAIKTQDEILTDMLSHAASLIEGLVLSAKSDAYIKYEVIASQIAGLYEYLAFIEQHVAFPVTATGEFLDKHAEEIGITRKAANKATGSLRLYGVEGSVAPIGTVVATLPDTDGSVVELETTAVGTIEVGQTYINVAAQAKVGGISGNIMADTSLVFVLPPAGFTSVTNPAAFTNGSDAETDDELRERYLFITTNPLGAGTESDYERWALEIPGVQSARVVGGAGTVNVLITAADGIPSGTLIDSVLENINAVRPIGVSITVTAPTAKTQNIAVTVTVAGGYTVGAVTPYVQNVITSYINSIEIGGTFVIARLIEKLMAIAGVEDVAVTTPSTNVSAAATEMFVEGTVTIS
jgi:uncharacterized phage protein gp47/JayE